MKKYLVERRKRGTKGTFAIFPVLGYPECKSAPEIGRVRAYTHEGAVKLAQEIGIGEGKQIYACEVLPDRRVTVVEVEG